MADGDTLASSSNMSNSDKNVSCNDALKPNNEFIYRIRDDFYWKGDLNGLKELVKSSFNIEGKWSSLGGDYKLFYNEEFSLKWHGPTKKKLVVVKDNTKKYLLATLTRFVDENTSNTRKEITDVYGDESEHVAGINHQSCSKCENCEHFQVEIDNIMTLLNEIRAEQSKVKLEASKCAQESNAKIDMLVDDKNKMAADNEALRSTLEELVNENQIIKRFLDPKQNEWSDVETRKSASTSRNVVPANTVPLGSKTNRFSFLIDEVSSSSNEYEDSQAPVVERNETSIDLQINDYRKNQKRKYDQNNKQRQSQHNHRNSRNRNKQIQDDVKKTLVIGDSMVKHIDGNKITRAGKRKAICHSYSGATVGQIQSKVYNHWAEESQGYDTVILHVGTNDLVHRDCQEVAVEMEKLITDVKVHADKVAASAVMKRYDGKVRASKISEYNKLLHNLCIKHKIAYIDNDCIDQSLLNGSNLHLNRSGDRILGSAFCTYLKSNMVQNGINFFRETHVRPRLDWMRYLNYVNKTLNN